MRISEVSRLSGVPASTLRYHERIGLIASGRERNGYRYYEAEVIDRLALVDGAKHLDLSLPGIAELLSAVDGDTGTQVRESLRPRLAKRLSEVDDRLATLQRLRDRLLAASRRVDACPDSGDQCRTECMLMRERPCEPRPSRSGIAR